MNITLTTEDVAGVADHGSLVVLTGTDEHGRRVTFAGDHRPMGHIVHALLFGVQTEIEVEVEPWAVLGITEPQETK